MALLHEMVDMLLLLSSSAVVTDTQQLMGEHRIAV